MLQRGLVLLTLLAGLVAPSSSSLAAGKTFGAETFMLDNGMQVVVIPNHRAPVVHNAVWYKVGAADEPMARSGIAHMLEHLMFKGTPAVPDGAFSKIVARNGGNDNAFTSQDYTGYFQNIAVDRLEMVMEMEADRMVNLAFTDEQFLTERDVVMEERRSRTDNRPRAQFAEQISAAQFLAHPYRLPVIGWENDIETLTAADARAFYRRHYAPDNAILIVAGDVEVDHVKVLAERYFGPIAAAGIAERVRPKEPPQRAQRRLIMKDPRVASLEWSRSYLAPSYHSGESDLAVPLDLLARVLGGGTTSRLYQALVVEQKIADQAGGYYSGTAYDLSRFVLYGLPKAGVSIDDFEAAIEAEIARIVAEGVTDTELKRAKFGMRADAIYARDGLAGVARIFGSVLASGMTVDDVESWPDLVQAVTNDEIKAAAAAVFVAAQSVTGLLRPASDTAPEDSTGDAS